MENKVINFFANNYHCRSCFNNPRVIKSKNTLQIGEIVGPQPRWIGKDYFSSKNKICLILINPGSGDSNTPKKDWDYLKELNVVKDSKTKKQIWDKIMSVNSSGMPKWGNWEQLYFRDLGLKEIKNEIAFMNFMLCASKNNIYCQSSLQNCFFEKSGELLELLNPNIVIFSGHETIKFALKRKLSMREYQFFYPNGEIDVSEINPFICEKISNKAKFFIMSHYAYYNEAKRNEAKAISKVLKNYII